MTTVTFASRLYSSEYKVDVKEQSLKELKKSNFHTHLSTYAEKLHWVSETVFLPARWNAQLLARSIQPLPGAGKDYPLWGEVIRVVSLALWIITLPLAATSVILALPLRCIDHTYRPVISYMDNSAAAGAKTKNARELLLIKEKPLHIRTHNLGFVPSSISITGDLRPPEDRAREVVKSILGDPLKPDIIFFQEVFHEDATRILCEGIKQEYPYIAHSIIPQISGLNSGAMFASKYPIEDIKFQRFGHMSAPETAAPRGITRVRLKSVQGTVFLYSVHTEALISEKRSNSRFHQLEEIRKFMQLDLQEYPDAAQFLMGDFNISRITVWGEDNLNPKGQAEERVLERFNNYFDDLYLRDHDPLNGARISGNARYLEVDNHRLNQKLPEPRGSWYYGPFANPGLVLSWKMHNDRRRYNRPTPQRAAGISMDPSTWGTSRWSSQQVANTARFDYILAPKQKATARYLNGRVEIRRVIVPKEAQSSPTDHLPVDGMVWAQFKTENNRNPPILHSA